MQYFKLRHGIFFFSSEQIVQFCARLVKGSQCLTQAEPFLTVLYSLFSCTSKQLKSKRVYLLYVKDIPVSETCRQRRPSVHLRMHPQG